MHVLCAHAHIYLCVLENQRALSSADLESCERAFPKKLYVRLLQDSERKTNACVMRARPYLFMCFRESACFKYCRFGIVRASVPKKLYVRLLQDSERENQYMCYARTPICILCVLENQCALSSTDLESCERVFPK